MPGLKICTPATPRDAKGLLKTAVRDNNPVLVLEAELLYSSKGMVEPENQELLIPLGKAEVKREGSDVSVICYAQTVPLALATAARLEEEILAWRSLISDRSSPWMKERFSNRSPKRIEL